MEISDRARKLHRECICIDGHNDSLIEQRARGDAMDLAGDRPDYQVDLPRLQEGGVTAIFSMVGGAELHQSLELWDAMYWHAEQHPHDFLLVLDPSDIRAAKRENRIGLIGQLESCTLLGRSLHVLRVLYRIGVRITNLTHGEAEDDSLHGTKSPFDFCTLADREQARRNFEGLTEFGREAIPAMNELGLVVDLAHTQDASYFEAIELSTSPVVFSHGNVFALSPHWRNLTDDQLRALADNGGVIGLAFLPEFIDPDEPSLDRLVDHIEYVCDLVGDDHVGFGADYDGMGDRTAIPPDPSHLPILTQKMLDRGFPETTIRKFWGENFLRVLESAMPV
jgi:membrane dipeptidase